jgi:hypothetical protein
MTIRTNPLKLRLSLPVGESLPKGNRRQGEEGKYGRLHDVACSVSLIHSATDLECALFRVKSKVPVRTPEKDHNPFLLR